MANVFRCYTEKREGFDVEAKALLKDLTGTLGVTNLTGLRLLNRCGYELKIDYQSAVHSL